MGFALVNRLKGSSYSLHHLPTKGQNLFYSLFLVFSPLLNLAINLFAFEDFRRLSKTVHHHFSLLNLLSEISGGVLGVTLVLLGVCLVFVSQSKHQALRKFLLLFGILSSFYLFINLCTVSYGIFAFKVESVALLLVSAGIYCSLNIVFLFWYWYCDYPNQVKHLHHPEHPVQIAFPTGKADSDSGYVPSFLDYLYLTIMVSNTLGPPENHSPVGKSAKALQLIHSTTMLVLLVIFVSRAINTLA